MIYLADTNLLLRLANIDNPLYQVTDTAIQRLTAQGNTLTIFPQCLYEFYAVATRPASARGGLGYLPAQAKTEMARLRSIFDFRPDTADVFTEWVDLVASYGVSGVAAHDARLVAAMQVHGIANLLTFTQPTSPATPTSPFYIPKLFEHVTPAVPLAAPSARQ